jgi:hypothetical protein
MSYQKQLQEHYKAVKERLRMNAPKVSVVKAIPHLSAPQNTEPLSPKPGLLAEKEEKRIVSEALTVTSGEEYGPFMGGRDRRQVDRFADELRLSPKMPPIPGLVLDEPGAIKWQRVLRAVAAQHGLTPEEIMSTSRVKKVVRARFEVFYRLRIDVKMTYQKIAYHFNRDHTSIMHGVYTLRKALLDEARRQREDGGLAAGNHLTAAGNSPTLPGSPN